MEVDGEDIMSRKKFFCIIMFFVSVVLSASVLYAANNDARDIFVRIDNGTIRWPDDTQVFFDDLWKEYIFLDTELVDLVRSFDADEMRAFISNPEVKEQIEDDENTFQAFILYAAAGCEDVNAVKLLIEEGYDDYQVAQGMTPYMYALLFNPSDDVYSFFAGMTDEEEKLKKYASAYFLPVVYTAKTDRGVRMLVEAGALTDTSMEGYGALEFALVGNAGSTKFLIDYGFDPYTTFDDGRTMLYFVANSINFGNSLQALRASGVEMDRLYYPGILYDAGTISWPHDEDLFLLQFLAEYGDEITYRYQFRNIATSHPLPFLIEECPQDLIDAYPDLYKKAVFNVLSTVPDINGLYDSEYRSPGYGPKMTLKEHAAISGNVEFYNYAIEAGADPTPIGISSERR